LKAPPQVATTIVPAAAGFAAGAAELTAGLPDAPLEAGWGAAPAALAEPVGAAAPLPPPQAASSIPAAPVNAKNFRRVIVPSLFTAVFPSNQVRADRNTVLARSGDAFGRDDALDHVPQVLMLG